MNVDQIVKDYLTDVEYCDYISLLDELKIEEDILSESTKRKIIELSKILNITTDYKTLCKIIKFKIGYLDDPRIDIILNFNNYFRNPYRITFYLFNQDTIGGVNLNIEIRAVGESDELGDKSLKSLKYFMNAIACINDKNLGVYDTIKQTYRSIFLIEEKIFKIEEKLKEHKNNAILREKEEWIELFLNSIQEGEYSDQSKNYEIYSKFRIRRGWENFKYIRLDKILNKNVEISFFKEKEDMGKKEKEPKTKRISKKCFGEFFYDIRNNLSNSIEYYIKKDF